MITTAYITISDSLEGEVEIKDMQLNDGKIESVKCKYIDVIPCYECAHIPEEDFGVFHTLKSTDPFDFELSDIKYVA